MKQKKKALSEIILVKQQRCIKTLVKQRVAIGRELQSLAKLLTLTSLKYLGMVTEKSCNLSE